MSNTINIALSALTAAQTGIATAGKNIANASVDGYSRQQVIQGQEAGLGDGTAVTDIQRVFDSFLSAQQNAAQSASSKLQVQFNQIQMINDYFADPATGVGAALQDFFNSLQDVSVAPKDATTRQGFLNSANQLVAGFNDAQSLLTSINANVDKKINASVANINAIAQQIANINAAILSAQGQGVNNNQTLNALYDKRDLLITELSKETSVKVVNNNNIYDVLVGNSQSLISGTSVNSISASQEVQDSTVYYKILFSNKTQSIELSSDDMAGGQLQGLIDFKTDLLLKLQNTLRKIAYGIAHGVNQINAEGYTLAKDALGNLIKGGDIFVTPDVDKTEAFPFLNFAANLKLKINNVNQIAASSEAANSGDNKNIVKMLALQTQKSFDDVSSYSEAYAQLVSLVGSKTKELSLTNTTASTILDHAKTAFQNDAGVNLDEEAANLIKYQQAYQAAGKLIEISKLMFDTLMQVA